MSEKPRFGISLVYGKELRFTNLTEEEAAKIIRDFGKPSDITTSVKNAESEEKDTLEQAKELANKLRVEQGFPKKYGKRKPKTVTKFDRQIAAIRKALKSLCPTFSVRRDRGVFYGTICISGSLEYGKFTEEEKRALEKFGLTYSGNYALILSDDREYWIQRAAEIMPEVMAALLKEAILEEKIGVKNNERW